MTLQEGLMFGKQQLEEVQIEDASLDAWYLLEHVCKIDRVSYYMQPEKPMSSREIKEYKTLIIERRKHIPLQYLTKDQMFMGLSFFVNQEVLIPRQDTESLVEAALKVLKPGMDVLDMCTGSGCILISLMKFCQGLKGTGVDVSKGALEVAKKNAKIHKVAADFIESDLFLQIDGLYDMIISNPPYIKRSVLDTLMPEVKDHEPMVALDGDEDGLSFYKRMVKESESYLKPGGYLYFEIGHDQGREVSCLMERQGYTNVKVEKDLAGLDRIVYGRRRIK
ncbi:MAG TPA: peptide chain release factor N(5)-glutamine methyltransferase [Candidatus Merdenecus merdavium]|nr:peptide chain release factor N(5)-glutamine methyltransferase [Candidatus Merdenecus merdavium]